MNSIYIWTPEEIDSLEERNFCINGRETNFFYGLVNVEGKVILCHIIPGIGFKEVRLDTFSENNLESIMCLFNLFTFNPIWYQERSSEDEFTIKQTLKNIDFLKKYNAYQSLVRGEIEE